MYPLLECWLYHIQLLYFVSVENCIFSIFFPLCFTNMSCSALFPREKSFLLLLVPFLWRRHFVEALCVRGLCTPGAMDITLPFSPFKGLLLASQHGFFLLLFFCACRGGRAVLQWGSAASLTPWIFSGVCAGIPVHRESQCISVAEQLPTVSRAGWFTAVMASSPRCLLNHPYTILSQQFPLLENCKKSI